MSKLTPTTTAATGTAILSDKRRNSWFGYYLVTYTCSECSYSAVIALEGWTIFRCLGCKALLKRAVTNTTETDG